MILNSDVINKIIDTIGPKFFNDDFTDLSKNRIGVFGMVSETMGTLYENSIINNAVKARERLTITASRPTLLQEAYSYPELTIPKATPAYITLRIGIPVSYLEQNTRWYLDSNNIYFTLHKDTIISISGIPFLLPYSVNIIGKKIDGKFKYSAQYTLDGENLISSISNPYLITQTLVTNNVTYFLFTTTLAQTSKSYNYYNITETERVSLQGIEFSYDDQLSYFNIFHRQNSTDDFALVEKYQYSSKLVSSNPYIYYSDSEPGKIRLYIPDSFNFDYNSELRLDIYTTKGKSGNFTYLSGEVQITPQSFEDSINYTGISFNPVVLTNSEGGTDELTTEEIRTQVINYKSTLRSIDTENDLNIYFASQDVINNMIFVKKRIDVYDKKYTAFMVLRDENSNIISTNSLDTTITDNDIDENYTQTSRKIIYPSNAYSLKSGEDFVVEKNVDIFEKISRIRIRVSGNDIDAVPRLRRIDIVKSDGTKLTDADLTITDGVNSDGTVDVTNIAYAFDDDDSTNWDLGNVSVMNDATKFKEVILTINTPIVIKYIEIASAYDVVTTYPLGSVEFQYENNAGTSGDGSDGTWVSLISATALIVSEIETTTGNTFSKKIPIEIKDDVVATLEEDPSKFLFGSPYLIVVNDDPPSISYYLNSINKDHAVNIEFSNESAPLQFIINKFNISRNAIIGENTYKISFNMFPASDLPDGIVDNNGNILDISNFKLYGFVYSVADADTIEGYFPMEIKSYNLTDDYFVVEANIETDNYITLNDELRLVNNMYYTGTENVYDRISPISNVKFGIAIYYNDGVYTEKQDFSNVVPDTVVGSYGLLNVYTNESDLSTLMINMSKYINSVVSLTSPGGVINYDIKQIPMLRYSELVSNLNRVTNVILNTYSIMKTILTQIRNNSSIDFKFFATYGKSRYFNLESTTTKLDRLDITIKFRVRMSSIKTDTSLISDLKAFIQPLIENINTSVSANNSIYFSNIITKVENEFVTNQERIYAFELAGINTYSTVYQSLINNTPKIEDMSKDELLQYIPEFIKLDVNNIEISVILV